MRANFRLGNTVLVTSLLAVLRVRFPDAGIDILSTDATACLLEGLGIGRVHALSRSHIFAPWRFLRLFRRIRQERYDAAIDGGMTSFSGALYCWLSGAGCRIGGRGPYDFLLTSPLALGPAASVYAAPVEVGRALGVEVPDAWPRYCVQPEEQVRAADLVRRIGLAPAAEAARMIAIFVGGHSQKRWPENCWISLLELLEQQGLPAAVFVGPEEQAFAKSLGARTWRSVHLVAPQPVRVFAALLQRAAVLVTPDSGPLHLAAALQVRVIVLLQVEKSRFFVPPLPSTVSIVDATPARVLAALRAQSGISRCDHIEGPLRTGPGNPT